MYFIACRLHFPKGRDFPKRYAKLVEEFLNPLMAGAPKAPDGTPTEVPTEPPTVMPPGDGTASDFDIRS
jgi:hypothetical protein